MSINDDYSPASAEREALEALQAEVMTTGLEKWRDAAVKEYPAVSSLRDYLTAGSAEGVKSLAGELAEKLSGQTQQQRPSPPVPGGNVEYFRPNPDEELQGIIQDAARRLQDERGWTNYLREKFERAGSAYPPDQP